MQDRYRLEMAPTSGSSKAEIKKKYRERIKCDLSYNYHEKERYVKDCITIDCIKL